MMKSIICSFKLIGAAVRRNGTLSPVGDRLRFKKGDEVYFFVFEPEMNAAGDFLKNTGWTQMESMDQETFTTSLCHLA